MTLHIDGFEQFTNDPGLGTPLLRADYITEGSVPVGVVGRVAGLALACSGGAFGRLHPWAGNSFVAGCAAQFSGRGSILWMDFGGGEILTLWVSPDDGQPRLNDTECGSLPVLNTWYYFEVELDRAGGTAKLYVNNRLDGTATLTAGMEAATEVTVRFGMLAPSTYRTGVTITDSSSKSFDDIYLRDGARLGPIAIKTRFPTQTLLNDTWATSSASAPNQIVSTLPPDLLDNFIAADEVGDEVKFDSSVALPNDNPILATALAVLVRKAPLLEGRLRGYIGGDATVTLREKEVDVASTWEMQYLVFETDAGDTKAGIEAAPFGVEVVAPE